MLHAGRFAASLPLVLAVSLAAAIGTGCGMEVVELPEVEPSAELPDPSTGPGRRIVMVGGYAGALSGTGGRSGLLEMSIDHGGDGRIAVLAHGDVEETIEARPLALIETSASTRRLRVESDLVLLLDPPSEPPLGSPYAVSGDVRIFVSDGDGTMTEPAEAAVGLHVIEGATLELALNFGDTAAFDLGVGDIVNHGSIEVEDVETGVQAGSIELVTDGLYVGSGEIDASAALAGELSGHVLLDAATGIFNAGAIRAQGSGRRASDGGRGGDIQLLTDGPIENAGPIRARGGEGMLVSSRGGQGGSVVLRAGTHVASWGSIDVEGGEGLARSGSGGTVSIESGNGDVQSSGRIYASSGSQGDRGGMGGDVTLRAVGGELRVTAGIGADGGYAGGVGGIGGEGGHLLLTTEPLGDAAAPLAPAGDVLVGASLSAEGGTGLPTGGDAGHIEIRVRNGAAGSGSSIELRGFGSLALEGGPGGRIGGHGGTVRIHPSLLDPVTSASVRVEAKIRAPGGFSDPTNRSSVGGNGGNVLIEAPAPVLGELDLEGGDAYTRGRPGKVVLF